MKSRTCTTITTRAWLVQVGLIQDGVADADSAISSQHGRALPGPSQVAVWRIQYCKKTNQTNICAEEGLKHAEPGVIFIVSVEDSRCRSSLPSPLLYHCEELHPCLFPLCSEQAGLSTDLRWVRNANLGKQDPSVGCWRCRKHCWHEGNVRISEEEPGEIVNRTNRWGMEFAAAYTGSFTHWGTNISAIRLLTSNRRNSWDPLLNMK